MNLLQPLLADISSVPWVALVAVAGGIILTIVIIVGGLMIAYHRQKQWHETARLAMEKGVPLPPLPDMPPAAQAEFSDNGPGRDFRAGLISLATGAGLFLCLDALLGRWMAYVGAIPGFIGIALILYATGSLIFSRKDRPAEPNSKS
jgi:hypothetical protein